jgi:hypothetical protein
MIKNGRVRRRADQHPLPLLPQRKRKKTRMKKTKTRMMKMMKMMRRLFIHVLPHCSE